MTCASCGAANEAGRKFCLNCGARLAVACPACATPNPPQAKFCGECGTALHGNDAPPAGAAAGTPGPATERRLVSVLFADLVGFTTISEARDAEDVRALLDAYFDLSRSIVERYGGTVEKFIGDAVMAVWGSPTTREDDAERAVRAALDLVDAVRRLSTDRHIPELALRAAVHTGEAVVTLGASGMGMVAGDLVNTASRLQSVAPAGTVLVGEGTQRAASNAIAFEAAGEHELKGKVAPVPAFTALRVVAQRGGVGRSEQLEPPFVGRNNELQLIKDFYHATARDPGPRLVSVIGQAGIGKSRLAWEFLKYIDGVTEVVYWHQGRSPAYGEGISFWALGEMVRMRLGIGEGADEASTRRGLAAVLEEFVADLEERRTLEEPLLHLLGIGEGRPRERGQLFLAWRTFFERIAERGPVVMVFEDLQWADDGLLDFIEELLTWSRNRSIYIITLARPELFDRRPAWGAGHRAFTSLSLSPLSDGEMRELMAGLVPGLPSGVVDRIVGRAEGIPLFAVETVRTLLNGGRIERRGDRFEPVGDLAEIAMPESLHGLIAARIDALPAEERTLIQDASVLGQSFGIDALRAVSRAAPDAMAPMLQHLVQREVLTVDDDPRSPERGQFRFVQGLLREVAYGTLSRDERRSRHLAAARYFEALGDDELSGVLAQHYVDAYRAHPDGPEGAAVGAQARVALKAAALRASDLGSKRLALGYVERALEVTSEPFELLDLRSLATDLAAEAGLANPAIAHGEEAIQLATKLGEDHQRRLAIARLANILIEGQQGRALRLLTDTLSEPDMAPGVPGYLEVASLLAKAEMRSTGIRRSIEIADEVLPHAIGPGTERTTLDLLITRGVAISHLDRSTEAVTILSGALELATRLGLRDEANRAAVNLGFVVQPDDPVRAFEVSRAMVEGSKRDGVIWGIRYILGNAVDAAVEVGEWDWAIAQMEELDPLFTEPAEQTWFGVFRTTIDAYRGEDVEERAMRFYEESRAIDDPQYRYVGAYGLVVAGLVAADAERVARLVREDETRGWAADTAVYGARAAVWAGDAQLAREMRAIMDQATRGRRTDAHRGAIDAGIAQLEGRTVEARALYGEAQRATRALGTVFLLGLLDLDIVVTGAMDADERRRAADEAREIFTRLRATALLDRLDAALTADDGQERRARAEGAAVAHDAPPMPARSPSS